MGDKSDRRGRNSPVARHLQRHLGQPFNVLVEEVAPGVPIRFSGFVDTPAVGQVTLVTDGLAMHARRERFAGSDGYAQELVFVVGASFFGEDILGFFLAMASMYVRERALLSWDTPIRLTAPVPGGDDLRYLLPSPAAVFESDFQFVDEAGKATNFCLMIPLYEAEANLVLDRGVRKFYDELDRLDVELSDLRRAPMTAS